MYSTDELGGFEDHQPKKPRERIPFKQSELAPYMKGSPVGTTFAAVPAHISRMFIDREISEEEFKKYLRDDCPEGYVVD